MLIVTVFTLLAFGITWSFWGPLALEKSNVLPEQSHHHLRHFIGGIGPFFSAFVLVWWSSGMTGVGQWLLNHYSRPSPTLVLLSFLWPILCALPAIALYRVVGQLMNFSHVHEIFSPKLFFGSFFFTLLVISLEELGWRGFLLPYLLSLSFSPTASSLTVGFLWSLWHIPLFFHAPPHWVPGRPFPLIVLDIAGYTLGLCLLSIPMTFLYQESEGNIWPALVYHASLNGVVTGFRPKWQLMQGGYNFVKDGNYDEAAFRELGEEVGLSKEDITIVSTLEEKIAYQHEMGMYQGQEIKWVLFFWKNSDIAKCKLDNEENPEFTEVAFLDWDELLSSAATFKLQMYTKLREVSEPIIQNYCSSLTNKLEG